MDLQGSCFTRSEIRYYWKDITNILLLDALLEDDLLSNIDFALVLICTDCKLVFTRGSSMLDNGFISCEKVSVALESKKISGLQYIVFVCESDFLCYWSEDLGHLVALVENIGGHCVLVSKSILQNDQTISETSMSFIEPKSIPTAEERSKIFHDYISSDCSAYRTKNSDFLFKTAFQFHSDDRGFVYESVIHYFERAISSVVYGYINLDFGKFEQRSQDISNFWFRDLHNISGCEAGAAHIACFNGYKSKTFYFVLFCSDKESVLCGLDLLRDHHAITIMNYKGSATSFVHKYMHYKSNTAYFNTYFLGIFNDLNWLLFSDVFQYMERVLMCELMHCETAINEEDNDTIEYKYKLRFAYYLYNKTLVRTVPDL